MARKVTIAAFEKWIADEANEAIVLESIAGGLTLQKTSLAVKQPFTCLHAYFHATPERQARYEQARKSWADSKMDEAMELADEVTPDKDNVAKAKLQIETRQVQAKAYYRDRWGEKLQVDKNVTVAVDVGPATRLLEEARRRELEVTVLPALEEKAAG